MILPEEAAAIYKKKFPGAKIYGSSFIKKEKALLFMIREGQTPYLIILGDSEFGFEGQRVDISGNRFLKCYFSHENCSELRNQFSFTRPVLLGTNDSYGLGDRLGNAGAAHLKAIKKTHFKPVLAQQSIRELERTGRTAEDVMNAATRAVFREGYREGFGADGDHLKTEKDIDLMMDAGFTMFTIDPGEYVRNEALHMAEDELRSQWEGLPWNMLESDPHRFMEYWKNKELSYQSGSVFIPTAREIYAAMVKYGRVISHTKKLSDYIRQAYPQQSAELELSVDETDQPTTLFEHYLIASELQRLGVRLVSLAPRFCGDFEKGVDFRGDLNQFREEYLQHLGIAAKFGGYKLSIHSGSDKFSVYDVIGSLSAGNVHVKTAGTSYLEALRTVAETDPELFVEILGFSMQRFEADKKTYQISGRPENIKIPAPAAAESLKKMLDDEDTRQVLHVAYGSVLHGQGEISTRFKKELMNTLSNHEELYEYNLEKHFDRHLEPFSGTH